MTNNSLFNPLLTDTKSDQQIFLYNHSQCSCDISYIILNANILYSCLLGGVYTRRCFKNGKCKGQYIRGCIICKNVYNEETLQKDWVAT